LLDAFIEQSLKVGFNIKISRHASLSNMEIGNATKGQVAAKMQYLLQRLRTIGLVEARLASVMMLLSGSG
jgi:hypothetical protein